VIKGKSPQAPEITGIDYYRYNLNNKLTSTGCVTFSNYTYLFVNLPGVSLYYRWEKIATEDIEWADTISIKAGDIISIPVYGLHRSIKYHTEPDTFIPERFLKESYQKTHPYIPAPRAIPLLNNIAISIAKTAIFKLISEVKIDATETETTAFVPGLSDIIFPAEALYKCTIRNGD